MMKSKQAIIALLFMVILVPCIDAAKAKLMGTVYDNTNPENIKPLGPAVTVMLKEHGKGTYNEDNGEYFILNVPVEEITITASMVGYEEDTRTIIIDDESKTYELDFYLKEKPIEADELEVVGQREHILTVEDVPFTGKWVTVKIDEVFMRDYPELIVSYKLELKKPDDETDSGRCRIEAVIPMIGTWTVNCEKPGKKTFILTINEGMIGEFTVEDTIDFTQKLAEDYVKARITATVLQDGEFRTGFHSVPPIDTNTGRIKTHFIYEDFFGEDTFTPLEITTGTVISFKSKGSRIVKHPDEDAELTDENRDWYFEEQFNYIFQDVEARLYEDMSPVLKERSDVHTSEAEHKYCTLGDFVSVFRLKSTFSEDYDIDYIPIRVLKHERHDELCPGSLTKEAVPSEGEVPTEEEAEVNIGDPCDETFRARGKICKDGKVESADSREQSDEQGYTETDRQDIPGVKGMCQEKGKEPIYDKCEEGKLRQVYYDEEQKKCLHGEPEDCGEGESCEGGRCVGEGALPTQEPPYCKDYYTLIKEDGTTRDCWEEGALCIPEQKDCVKFEYLIEDEEVLRNILILVNKGNSDKMREEAADFFVYMVQKSEMSIKTLEIIASVLIKVLETDNSDYVRDYAAFSLGFIALDSNTPKNTLELMASALKKVLETDNSEGTRSIAASSLGDMAQNQNTPPNTLELMAAALVKSLKTDNIDYVRRGATDSLGDIARNQNTPENTLKLMAAALVKSLKTDNSIDVRGGSTTSLGDIAKNLNTPKKTLELMAPALVKVLETDNSDYLRSAAVRPLGFIAKNLNTPEDTLKLIASALIKAMETTDNSIEIREIRRRAASSLGYIAQNPNTSPNTLELTASALVKALDDKKYGISQYAIESLAKIPQPELIGEELAKLINQGPKENAGRYAHYINTLHDYEIESSRKLGVEFKDEVREAIIKNLNFEATYYLIAIGGADLYTSTFERLFYFNFEDGTHIEYAPGRYYPEPRFSDYLERIKRNPELKKHMVGFILTLSNYNKLKDIIAKDHELFRESIKKALLVEDEFELRKNGMLLVTTIGEIFTNPQFNNPKLKDFKDKIESFLFEQYSKAPEKSVPKAIFGYSIKLNKDHVSEKYKEDAKRIARELPKILEPNVPKNPDTNRLEWIHTSAEGETITAKLYYTQEEWLPTTRDVNFGTGAKDEFGKLIGRFEFEEEFSGPPGFEYAKRDTFVLAPNPESNWQDGRINGLFKGVKLKVILTKNTDDVQNAFNDPSIAIVSHRGHSFSELGLFEGAISDNIKLIFLGGCGGFSRVADLQKSFLNAYFISDEGTGEGATNDRVLFYVMRSIANKKNQEKITWQEVYEEVDEAYSKTMKQHLDQKGIIFPHHKALLLNPFIEDVIAGKIEEQGALPGESGVSLAEIIEAIERGRNAVVDLGGLTPAEIAAKDNKDMAAELIKLARKDFRRAGQKDYDGEELKSKAKEFLSKHKAEVNSGVDYTGVEQAINDHVFSVGCVDDFILVKEDGSGEDCWEKQSMCVEQVKDCVKFESLSVANEVKEMLKILQNKNNDWMDRIDALDYLRDTEEQLPFSKVALMRQVAYSQEDMKIAMTHRLDSINNDEALQLLIDISFDADKEVQLSAMLNLGRTKSEKAVDALLTHLDDEDYDIKSRAIEMLGWIGSEKAIDPLIEILKGSYDWLRSAAARALGEIGSEKAVPDLILVLRGIDPQSYRDEHLYEAIIPALAMIGSKEVLPILKEELKNFKNPDQYKVIINAIGDMDPSAAIEFIEAGIDKDSYYEFTAWQIYKLGDLKAEKSIPLIAEFLQSTNRELVKESARALAKIGSKSALQYLREALINNKIFRIEIIEEIVDYFKNHDQVVPSGIITALFERIRISESPDELVKISGFLIEQNYHLRLVQEISQKINSQTTPDENKFQIYADLINDLHDLENRPEDVVRIEIIKRLSFESVYYLLSLGGADLYTSTFEKIFYVHLADGTDREISPGIRYEDPIHSDYLERIPKLDEEERFMLRFILIIANHNKLIEIINKDAKFFMNAIYKALSFKDNLELRKNGIFLTTTIQSILTNDELNNLKPDMEKFLFGKYSENSGLWSWFAGLVTKDYKFRKGLFGYFIKINQEFFSRENRQLAIDISGDLPPLKPPIVPDHWYKDNQLTAKLYFTQRGQIFRTKNNYQQFFEFIEEENQDDQSSDIILVLDPMSTIDDRVNGEYKGISLRLILTESLSDIKSDFNDPKIDIIGHRGHSYQEKDVFSEDSRSDLSKLAYMGACGGFGRVAPLQENLQNFYFISDEGTGEGDHNDRILFYVMRSITLNSDNPNGVLWEKVKQDIIESYANLQRLKLPDDIIFPEHPAMLLKPFIEDVVVS